MNPNVLMIYVGFKEAVILNLFLIILSVIVKQFILESVANGDLKIYIFFKQNIMMLLITIFQNFKLS